MSESLTVAVAHHPARAGMLAEILAGLDERPEVVVDPEPDGPPHPWRTARLAWERGARRRAAHHLVLEDDILPCRDLVAGARQAIAARPDALVSFWSPEWFVAPDRPRWTRVAPIDWYGTLAVAMPSEWIADLLAFAGTGPRSHDQAIRDWAMHEGEPIWCTGPSLVEHRVPGRGLVDSNRLVPRTAGWFIGRERSALELRW